MIKFYFQGQVRLNDYSHSDWMITVIEWLQSFCLLFLPHSSRLLSLFNDYDTCLSVSIVGLTE